MRAKIAWLLLLAGLAGVGCKWNFRGRRYVIVHHDSSSRSSDAGSDGASQWDAPAGDAPPVATAPAIGDAASGADSASDLHASSDAFAACPIDMLLVDGNYCPEVLQNCKRWMDPPGPYEYFRCAEYAPSECLSKERKHLRFCIDRYEYTPPGDTLPAVHQSWTSARDTCARMGKRLCMESEWQLACEGEDMHPYPYGSGFLRDSTACNIDRYELGKPNAGLRDLREQSGTHPRCTSPYGVHDMSGNVEEWASLDHPIDPTDRSTMKGAWWLPGRNTCRAATTGHGETYEGPQVGIRCCKDSTTP